MTQPTTHWHVAPPAPEEFFAQFPEYPRITAQLLYNRELRTDEEIDRFLHPAYPRDLHDAFLLGGMEDAVRTIQAALETRDTIAIHGDYDADGLTASAILYDVLVKLGADVRTFVPSRYEEGYGVASSTLERLQQEGVALVITVDCGISDAASIAAARKRGLKVIVTDHHVPPAGLPEAEAVVNPNLPNDPYPNKALTGAGVAFKLAQALLSRSTLSETEQERIEKWLLDLVAIGTVADMAELRGENRALVKYGLLVLKQSRRPGVRALLRSARIASDQLTAETIGFTIAPRLNAPGRIDHARDALRLLIADDVAEAERLAVELEGINQQRQRVTIDTVTEVRGQVGELTDQERIIILEGDWKSGIVGLVAGRLVREYSRPAVVIERGETLSRGSVRSIPALHVAEALQAHGELLESFGGHAQAGGFTIRTDRIGTFRKRLIEFARETIAVEGLLPTVEAEAELPGAALNWELLSELEDFEPFGVGNRKPQFLLKNVSAESVTTVGQDKSHLKCLLQVPDGPRLPAIGFGLASQQSVLMVGPVDVIGVPVVNEFNGSKNLEWRVEDIRPS